MVVYRLGRVKYAEQLNGEGARLHGGRWNTIGNPCIYTAESKSLCVLEYAANVFLDEITTDLSFTTIEIPDDCWATFSAKDLPAEWMETPSPVTIQHWGTQQLKAHLAIKLPSVIIPSEWNYLLNPLDPDFKKVKIKNVEPFTFDKRIKK